MPGHIWMGTDLCTQDNFIVLAHWQTSKQAPWCNITFSHIILTGPTSPCPIIIMQRAWLWFDSTLVWLDKAKSNPALSQNGIRVPNSVGHSVCFFRFMFNTNAWLDVRLHFDLFTKTYNKEVSVLQSLLTNPSARPRPLPRGRGNQQWTNQLGSDVLQVISRNCAA